MLLLVPQTTPASARANSKEADDASVLKAVVVVAHILNLDVNGTTMEGHLLILLIPNPAVELTSIVVSVSVLLGKAEPNL